MQMEQLQVLVGYSCRGGDNVKLNLTAPVAVTGVGAALVGGGGWEHIDIGMVLILTRSLFGVEGPFN